MIDREKYLYGVSRVRALEKQLISKASFSRMAEARDLSELLKALMETPYGELFGEVRVTEYEKALKKAHSDAWGEVKKLIADDEVLEFVSLRYLFHNLKAALKLKFANVADRFRVLEGMLFPVERPLLEKIIRTSETGEVRHLPDYMKETAKEAIAEFEATGDISSVDLVVERGMRETAAFMAEELGIGLFKLYAKALVDLGNIRAFLRAKRLNRDRAFLAKVLAEGGFIKKEVFIQVFAEPVDALLKFTPYTPYTGDIEEGIREYGKTSSFAKLDMAMDNYVVSIFRPAKFVNDGPEPILSFLISKEMEITNLRIVIVGKLNGIAPSDIKGRLRDVSP